MVFNLKLAIINVFDHVLLRESISTELSKNNFNLTREECAAKAKKLASKGFKAVFFCDPKRFSGLWDSLYMHMLKSKNSYLTTITRAYDMMNKYESIYRGSTA